MKKHITMIGTSCFLIAFAIASPALAVVTSKETCFGAKAACMAHAAKIRKEVNKLAESNCRAMPKKEPLPLKTITENIYNENVLIHPGLSTEKMRIQSGGACLLQARAIKSNCNLVCKTVWGPGTVEYELTGSGTTTINLQGGRLKASAGGN